VRKSSHSGPRVLDAVQPAARQLRCRVISRREVLIAAAALLGSGRIAVAVTPRRDVAPQLMALEHETGGRLGVAALNLRSGMRLTYRAAERFAMCSTFKLALAAAVLARVDAGGVKLGQSVSFTRADLVAHSPVTELHVNEGALPLATMLQAMIEVSDNTAANQLLGIIGGARAYTDFLRGLGDRTTRLDRIEPALNSNIRGDPRDTTTPSAMLADMNRLLFGTVLSGQSSERLITWMRQCSNGQDRLRARLPAGWRAADKPGTGEGGAVNDLAVFWAPDGAPILVACYMDGSSRSVSELSDAHARIGGLVAQVLI
jgi:beta-lactamase class A